MEDAIIKTGVNINLDQNDMVELMLEEQKEQREKLMDDVSSDILDNVNAYIKAKQDLEVILIDSNGIKMTAAYKKFSKAVTILDLEIIANCKITYNNEEIGEVVNWDLDRFEQYKNPMAQLRKAISTWNDYKASKEYDDNRYYNGHKPTVLKIINKIPKTIDNKFEANSNNCEFTLIFRGDTLQKLKINSKAKKLIQKTADLAKKELTLRKQKANLELELFNLENGNKRNKSKFIKSMLKNSETGKSLVTLMEGIQGTDLLQLSVGKEK